MTARPYTTHAADLDRPGRIKTTHFANDGQGAFRHSRDWRVALAEASSLFNAILEAEAMEKRNADADNQ